MPAAPHCDPERGVFETLLAVDGRPIELDPHLERLEASLAILFDSALPADARRLALDGARPLALGRLRLTATPLEGGRIGLDLAAESLDPELAFPARKRSVELRSLPLEGGFGSHKWADRGLLERAEAELPDGAAPLIVDRDGAALEASRANVFAVRGGALLTPPADGRIVPGITRRRVLDLFRASGREAREEPLSLADLLGADEVFLTNSVRGVEPVGSIDGARAGAVGEVSAGIAAELRRSWLAEAAPAGSAAAVP